MPPSRRLFPPLAILYNDIQGIAPAFGPIEAPAGPGQAEIPGREGATMDINDPNGSNPIKLAQSIKDNMLQMMNEAGSKTITVSSGGGMVTVVVNLKSQIVSLSLEREVVNPDDIEMLTDLIVAAVNQGLEQVQQEISQRMGQIALKLNIPINPE
jgi:DNA-binding YbaB/EbfC family protein